MPLDTIALGACGKVPEGALYRGAMTDDAYDTADCLTETGGSAHLVDRIRRKVVDIGGFDLEPMPREAVRDPDGQPLPGSH